MNVHLTFDVEVWCNGWTNLDREFATCYPRYVYGRSPRGDYALPKTLEILARHGLHGIFFVEPLFSARFGHEYLERIVRLIDDAGQEVQLHLHPEWTDEIRPSVLLDISHKRQHLVHYSLEEQTKLICYGKKLLESALGKPVNAFRSGSFAANSDTFEALERNGLLIDSSINICHPISAPDIILEHGARGPFSINGVDTFPISVFRDGFGRLRPAQVGACGYGEMSEVMIDAAQGGWTDFVVVSHNFEMLKPGKSEADQIVARRFENLCRFLSAHANSMPTNGFPNRETGKQQSANFSEPRAKWPTTAWRHVEQATRRVL